MAEKTIQQSVINILAGQIGVSTDNIKPDQKLVSDLRRDSLDLVEILIELEVEFGIEIDDDQFITLTTVQQVIEHVAGICTAPASAS